MGRWSGAAAQLEAAGIEVYRGTLDEPDTLRAGAAAADGVIHCAFDHRNMGNLPVESVATDRAVAHWTWLEPIFALDGPASNTITRELLGWEPTHRTLIEDVDAGLFFTS